jgi:hypothetical protein
MLLPRYLQMCSYLFHTLVCLFFSVMFALLFTRCPPHLLCMNMLLNCSLVHFVCPDVYVTGILGVYA